jgi:hypothetical protein
VQRPDAQESPAQQAVPAPHAAPSAAQLGAVPQRPSMHESPVQHSAEDAHAAPLIWQGRAQRPLSQRVPRQQSLSPVHAPASA